MEVHGYGRVIPFTESYKDFGRMICNLESDHHSDLYVIDIPRALDKKNCRQFFAAIETLKDGRASDDRYSFKSVFFDSPAVWVVVNKTPDVNFFTSNRWNFWMFTSEKEFKQVPYKELIESVPVEADPPEFSYRRGKYPVKID